MRILGWLLAIFSSLGVVGAVAGLGLVYYLNQDLPDFTQLQDYEPAVVTRLHAGDGHVMAEYATENRVFVPIEAIPPHVIQAFVSAEDQHFYSHAGIDPLGIARAIVTNVRYAIEGRRLIGASTITQLVARNFLLTNEVSLIRKLREQLLALRIERVLSKEEILELFFNEIYLGRGAYGIAAAALIYFNKPLSELTLAEAAYLAALPKAPSNYDPRNNMDAALERRSYVIGRMFEDGAITAEEAEAADAEPIVVIDSRRAEFAEAGYFSEEVRRELQRLYGSDQLYEGGLTVYTTMDPRLQEIAERVLREGLETYDLRHGYRGPIEVMEEFDDWPGQLALMDMPAGALDGWQLGVVLEVEEGADSAILGFSDRSRGLITTNGLEWAIPWLPGQRVGSAPNSVDDALALGDVVLVERIADVPAGFDATLEGDENAPDLAGLYGLRQIPDVQGALVAIDPETGRVLAMVGGYDFSMSEFNRATQAARQPGSAFKPFVYLAALNLGYTPSTIVLDIPLAIQQAGQPDYRPSNYDGTQLGPVPMRVGVERSRNLMTVRILQEIGLDPVREIARTYGIYDDMPLLYSMALGAGEVSPLALTNAYAMLANGGRRIDPTLIDRIQDRYGNTVYRHDTLICDACRQPTWAEGIAPPALTDGRELINDPVSTYQLTSMLQGVIQRGTAARLASLGLPLAGKTGTTNDAYDAWFVGFAPNLAVGVFVGFDNPRTLGPRETGGSVAAPIFGAFMREALSGSDPGAFSPPPTGVELVAVDADTGLVATGGGLLQPFRTGTAPTANDNTLPLGGFGENLGAATQGTGGLY
ncbi:MAG: penicillin-binding protein 1A [Pseudomonadota bacterium]